MPPVDTETDNSAKVTTYKLTSKTTSTHQDDENHCAGNKTGASYTADPEEYTSYAEYEAAASQQWIRRYRDALQETQRRIEEDPDAYLRARQQRAANRRLAIAASTVNHDVVGEAAPHSGGRDKSRWKKGRQLLNKLWSKRRDLPGSKDS